ASCLHMDTFVAGGGVSCTISDLRISPGVEVTQLSVFTNKTYVSGKTMTYIRTSPPLSPSGLRFSL
ncbi:MAG: hypothetical protein ACPIOQ_30055, partial [Promethearchaeia archaeon]